MSEIYNIFEFDNLGERETQSVEPNDNLKQEEKNLEVLDESDVDMSKESDESDAFGKSDKSDSDFSD